jgi:hypothetical protein
MAQQSHTNESATSIGDILTMDDRIADMSPRDVQHAVACSTLMHKIARVRSTEFMLSHKYALVEGLLQDGQIKAAAQIGLERVAPARSKILDADDPTACIVDMFFTDSATDAKFRQHLRDNVRGCGMADIRVARERIYATTGGRP